MFYTKTFRKGYWLFAATTLAFLLILSLAFAQQAKNRKVVVVEKDNGATIELSRSDRLVIKLPAQFGTGYKWDLTQADGSTDKLKLIEKRTQQASQPEYRLGNVEMQVFELKPEDSGLSSVTLAYRRPFDKQSVTKRFTIHVRVE